VVHQRREPHQVLIRGVLAGCPQLRDDFGMASVFQISTA
jgi:hypothetical protein